MAPLLLQYALGASVWLSQIHFSTALDAQIYERDVALTPPAALPGSWSYQGCYTEVGRTLNGASYSNDTTMTDESCISFCSAKGFLYAGTEYASQCFCDSTIAPGALAVNATDCSMACTGNATESCGGPNRLSLFWSGQTGPVTDPGPPNWAYVGCYTEGITGRLLGVGVSVPGGASNMTVAGCTSACQAAGYILAGCEYGGECWCENTFTNGGTIAPTTPDGLSGCSSLCNGNFSEYCGGASRLNVYNFNKTIATVTSSATASPTQTPAIKPTVGPYTYFGCQTEGNGTRALAAAATASDTMTLEACESFCGNYAYWGTEYGRECYCGNSFGQGSVAAPNSDCSMLCPGDVTEYCGAGNRLSVYFK
ncbi:WSC-domain protein [Hyaloscypha bicolor E]|uniref:WSC-domain protein n=1 Tax=Hyaloscypha bicolor E TaxID=1095630 RepID=A0A2J6TBM0_9HELO|nr:WSC-domain protein [Hyaloscypha bicolor E]PMD60425.1 WSC-domain protein [Hyaloscypha bicolor E]